MPTPSQIYVDDSGKVHVSYPCEVCSEWVHTDDHCGDTLPDGRDEYMCPDCYMEKDEQKLDAMYIHDWLIFIVDFDNVSEVRVAIHKSIATPNKGPHADCSSPDPDDDISRFGPGTCAMSLKAIDDLHMDVNHVYTLVDEGYIDGKKAHLIFQEGGAA